MATAKYSLVFHGDGFQFHWTVVEGPKSTGPVVMTSRDYPGYKDMVAASTEALKAIRADDFEVYDCEEKEKVVALSGRVVAVSKLAGRLATWHVVSNANWVLQMRCDICPCKKGDPINIQGKVVRVGTHTFRLVKTFKPDNNGGFTIHNITEAK